MYCGERITRSAVSLPPRRAEASADALSRGGGGGSDGGGDMIEKTKPTAVSVVALVSSGALQKRCESRKSVRECWATEEGTQLCAPL
jgi:hypothetical protein